MARQCLDQCAPMCANVPAPCTILNASSWVRFLAQNCVFFANCATPVSTPTHILFRFGVGQPSGCARPWACTVLAILHIEHCSWVCVADTCHTPQTCSNFGEVRGVPDGLKSIVIPESKLLAAPASLLAACLFITSGTWHRRAKHTGCDECQDVMDHPAHHLYTSCPLCNQMACPVRLCPVRLSEHLADQSTPCTHVCRGLASALTQRQGQHRTPDQ